MSACGGLKFEDRSYFSDEMEKQQGNSSMGAAGGRVELQLMPLSPEDAHASMMQFGGPASKPASNGGSWGAGDGSCESSSNYKEELMGQLELLYEIVTGHDMDSKKTEKLTNILPTQDPRLESCFTGLGQWDPSIGRFGGAPDWRAVASAMEQLLHDLQCQHISLELDLDEQLIDALATDPGGFISFDQFASLLAEADSTG